MKYYRYFSMKPLKLFRYRRNNFFTHIPLTHIVANEIPRIFSFIKKIKKSTEPKATNSSSIGSE